MKGAAAAVFILALGAAIVLCLPLDRADADPFALDGVEYTLQEDGTVHITGGTVEDLVVTGTVTLEGVEYRVSAVAEGAFQGSGTLRSVTISGDVAVGDMAFAECGSLRTAVLGEGVERLGAYSFYYSEALETVSLPSTLTTVGEGPFWYCTSLRSVEVADGNPVLEVVDGALVNRSDGGHLVVLPARSGAVSYTVPDGIASIDVSAFYGVQTLRSVTLPDSVVFIGDLAFYLCTSLTSVDMPSSLEYLGALSFAQCRSLTDVAVPAAGTYGGQEFQDCTSLASATLAEGSTAVTDRMFERCQLLRDVHIPDSVVYIGTDAFAECLSLTSVELPAGLVSVGTSPFRDCSNLESIDVRGEAVRYASVDGVLIDTVDRILIQYPCAKPERVYSVPDGILTVGAYSFSGNRNLHSVEITEGVTVIEENAFFYCHQLSFVALPDTLTSIGHLAFGRCAALEEAAIPKNVASVGNGIFMGCPSLTYIEVDPANASFTTVDGILYTKDMSELVQFPGGKDQTVLTIPAGTSVRNGALYYCFGLMAIDVEDGNPYYHSVGGVLLDTTETVLCIVPSGMVGAYKVPQSVTTISTSALAGCYDVSLIFYRTDIVFEPASLVVGDEVRSATLHITAPPGLVIPDHAAGDNTRVVVEYTGGMDDTITLVIGAAVVLATFALMAYMMSCRGDGRLSSYLADIRRNLPYLRAMVVRDLKGRYKSSHMGILWHLVAPLLTVSILYIMYTSIRTYLDPDFWIYVVSGLLPFFFFRTGPMLGSKTLVSKSALIKKMVFPREIVVVAQVIDSLISLAMSYAVMVAFVLIMGDGIPLVCLLYSIPVIIVSVVFLAGTMLIVSVLNVHFRDFQFLINSTARVMFWITPIMFTIDTMSGVLLILTYLNPVSYFIQCYHDLIYYCELPDPMLMVFCIVIALSVFAIGYLVFRHYRDDLAEML